MGKASREVTRTRAASRRDREEETDQDYEWIVRGEEVTALFECALRYVVEENRPVAEQSVLELMRCLNAGGRGAGARVLAHFDACLVQLEQGEFEDAFEVLTMLKDSWVEALAALRRDRTRAAHVN